MTPFDIDAQYSQDTEYTDGTGQPFDSASISFSVPTVPREKYIKGIEAWEEDAARCEICCRGVWESALGTPQNSDFIPYKSIIYSVPCENGVFSVQRYFPANSPCGQPFPAAHGASGFVSVVAASKSAHCKPLPGSGVCHGYHGSGRPAQGRPARKYTGLASISINDLPPSSKQERTAANG